MMRAQAQQITLNAAGFALVIPKGMALWGSPKEIDFFLWGVLPKGGFWSIHHIFLFALGSLVLWGLKIKNADFG